MASSSQTPTSSDNNADTENLETDLKVGSELGSTLPDGIEKEAHVACIDTELDTLSEQCQNVNINTDYNQSRPMNSRKKKNAEKKKRSKKTYVLRPIASKQAGTIQTAPVAPVGLLAPIAPVQNVKTPVHARHCTPFSQQAVPWANKHSTSYQEDFPCHPQRQTMRSVHVGELFQNYQMSAGGSGNINAPRSAPNTSFSQSAQNLFAPSQNLQASSYWSTPPKYF